MSALVLLTLTLALVAYLTVSFIKKETPPRPPAVAQPPSFVQIQIFGYGESAPGEVVLDPEKNPWLDDLANVLRGALEFWAVDPAIRAEVKERLDCAAGERLTVSSFIRFPGGGHKLDGAAKDRIDNFMCGLGGKAAKWAVFGFASEEGERDANRNLSGQRAGAVKQYLCKNHNSRLPGCGGGSCPQAGTGAQEQGCGLRRDSAAPGNDVLVEFLGERHFINGVADSRSVVVAACRKTTDTDQQDKESGAPPCAIPE